MIFLFKKLDVDCTMPMSQMQQSNVTSNYVGAPTNEVIFPEMGICTFSLIYGSDILKMLKVC